MSILKKLSIALAAGLFAMLVPVAAMAESPQGTVTVSIQDAAGQAFSGDWYLHQGTTINGFLVRNGSAGETFDVNVGNYFLEVRGLAGDHPYYTIYSDNPQTVEENQSITYNVQYFETEEQMLIATGNPPDPVTLGPTEETTTTFIIDEHGCNNTLGYAWCEVDNTCVKYWTPACKVADQTPTEETQAPASETATTVVTNPASYIQVPTFETAPSPEVPTWETPPASSPASDTGSTDVGAVMPVQLAQTGAAAAIPLAASMLASWALIRRKRY